MGGCELTLDESMKLFKRLLGNRDFENYRDLLLVLLQKEMKVRYKDKMLGYLWSLASPLMFAIVYFFAFKLVMRVQIDDYPLILLSGLFPWQWFANAVGFSPALFVYNASIIQKVNFPRSIISLADSLNHLVHFLLCLPIIIGFVIFFQRSLFPQWIYGIPLLVIIQTLTIHGITLLLASLNLFVRDIERLVGIILQLIFFFTPIVYTIDLIPEKYHYLLNFNPAAPLMVNWQSLLVSGTLDYGFLGVSAIHAAVFLWLGYTVYNKLSWKFAELV